MQKFLARLMGSTQTETVHVDSATNLIAPQYNQFLLLAQQAAQQNNWEDMRAACQSGLDLARQESNVQMQQLFLNELGSALYKLEQYKAAEGAFLESLAIAQTLESISLIARTQIYLGELFSAQKNWDRAKGYFEQANDVLKDASDPVTQIVALEGLGKVYLNQGNPSYAVHLLKEAVSQAQMARNPFLGANVLGWLGKAHIAQGDKGAGRRFLEQAQRLSMQIGREQQALTWVVALAGLDLEDQDFRSAIERYQAAEDLARRLGRQPKSFYRETALNLSLAYRQLGNYAQAQTHAERALLHSQELDDQNSIALATASLGLAQQGAGRHESAAENLRAALAFHEAGVLNDEDDKAGLLIALGKTLQKRKQPEAASYFEQALELARHTQNREREAEALHLIGSVKMVQNEREAAIALWKEAVRLFESTGKQAAAARALCDLGNARRAQGNLNAALTDFENALTYLSNINDQVTRGLVLSNAANLYTQMGDVVTAESFYDDSIKIAREMHDSHSESIRLGNLAWFCVLTGRNQRALELFDHALSISRRLDDQLLVAIQTNNMGYAYARQGEHEAAIQRYDEALAILSKLEGEERWRAIFESNKGASLVEKDQLDAALPLYQDALQISERLDDKENLVRTQHRLALLYLKQDKRDEAYTLARTAYDAARRMGYRKGQADAAKVLGEWYSRAGDEPNAALFYEEAHRVYSMIQDPLAARFIAYASA